MVCGMTLPDCRSLPAPVLVAAFEQQSIEREGRTARQP
jgi:hypothetical protein